MKNSSLLISLFAIAIGLNGCNKHASRQTDIPESGVNAVPEGTEKNSSAANPDSGQLTPVRTNGGIYNEHRSPEQVKIDSIKAAKLKEKHGGK